MPDLARYFHRAPEAMREMEQRRLMQAFLGEYIEFCVARRWEGTVRNATPDDFYPEVIVAIKESETSIESHLFTETENRVIDDIPALLYEHTLTALDFVLP